MSGPRVRLAWALMLSALGLAGCDIFQRSYDRIEHYTSEGWQGEIFLFTPADRGPHPAILWLHGGAWQRGHASGFFDQCRVMVRQGYVCASASYRVAERDRTRPENALADARAAYRHLLAQASRLHIDPQRLSIGGGSAGGHLAALLATGQQGRHPPENPAAVVLFNPLLNLAPGKPDHQFVYHDWRALSPYHQLHQRLPPTLILFGDRDPALPVASARAFCEKARDLGGDCRLDIAPGQRHSFYNRRVSRWQFFRTLFEIDGFMRGNGLAP